MRASDLLGDRHIIENSSILANNDIIVISFHFSIYRYIVKICRFNNFCIFAYKNHNLRPIIIGILAVDILSLVLIFVIAFIILKTIICG